MSKPFTKSRNTAKYFFSRCIVLNTYVVSLSTAFLTSQKQTVMKIANYKKINVFSHRAYYVLKNLDTGGWVDRYYLLPYTYQHGSVTVLQ